MTQKIIQGETDKNAQSLIIQNKAGASKSRAISPHFITVLEKVNRIYGSALRELAQK